MNILLFFLIKKTNPNKICSLGLKILNRYFSSTIISSKKTFQRGFQYRNEPFENKFNVNYILKSIVAKVQKIPNMFLKENWNIYIQTTWSLKFYCKSGCIVCCRWRKIEYKVTEFHGKFANGNVYIALLSKHFFA